MDTCCVMCSDHVPAHVPLVSMWRTSACALWLWIVLFVPQWHHSSAAAISPAEGVKINTGVHRYPDSASTQPMYFRKMVLEDSSLYVGAIDMLIKFAANDISSSTSLRELNITSLFESHSSTNNVLTANVQKCLESNHDTPEFDCRNHIRGIIINREERLVYLCGTGAHKPQDFYLNEDLTLRVSDLAKMSEKSGLAKCPFDPDQESTLIFVRNGNPGGLASTYSATSIDNTLASSLIYRPRLQGSSQSYDLLRTPHQEMKWLKVPHFVASFDIGDYVFFFFREISVEHPYEDEVTYSRVARVCKKDTGGSTTLENYWTTFLKARINCSLPGANPYYFNLIRDVVYDDVDKAFYGIFTMTMGSTESSAVCRMDLNNIEKFFEQSHFQEQLDVTKLWQKVPDNKVPSPRPGQCSVDSKSLTSVVQQFIRSRPLMFEAIQASGEKPLYNLHETTLVRLAVQRVNFHKVLYLATGKGEIQKVALWEDESGVAHTRLLVTWMPFTVTGHPIRQMIVRDNELYASTDYEVIQFDVRRCSGYSKCTACSLDPQCGWNSGDTICQLYSSGLIRKVQAESSLETCSADNPERENACQGSSEEHDVKIDGFSVRMSCDSSCESPTPVQWYHNEQLVSPDGEKYVMGLDGTLIVMDTVNSDQGAYECRSLHKNRSILFRKHSIMMSDCPEGEEGIECSWKREFLKWCTEFNEYQTSMNEWLGLKENCTSGVDKQRCYVQN